jgi:DNA polymerase
METENIIKSNFSDISKEYEQFCISKKTCKDCTQFECYKNVVLSEGNGKNPIFMFVAESPGNTEILKDKPLIGTAGQELRNNLRELGFNKKNSILTNVMPCRPLNNKFPSDPQIVKYCFFKWLKKEISILKPKFIITCGAHSTRLISGKEKIKMSDIRGRWIFNKTYYCWTIATWHPSYVLRCKNDKDKQNVLIEFKCDLKKVINEWASLYSDRRLHMSDENRKKTEISGLIQTHNKMMYEYDKALSKIIKEEDADIFSYTEALDW